MKEIWKDIPNYEGLYQASNLGRIRSNYKSCKILKQSSDGRYNKVVLCKDQKKRTFKVHQLVAMAFLNHIPSGKYKVIDHIDNNPLNNNLCKLQINTAREYLIKDRNVKGYAKVGNKVRAKVCINGKVKHLGYFKTKEEATEQYKKAIL